MWSAPSVVDDPVGRRGRARTCGFDAGQAQRDAVRLGDLVQLGQLRRPLRVDEIDAFEVEHDRVEPWARCSRITARTRSSSASAVAKKRPLSSRSTAIPGNVSSPGCSSSSRNDLRAGLAAEQRHPRRGRDVDQPAEREDDADRDAREHAGREHAEDRRDGDPEVEPRDPVQAPELADVDHPEHDRVDDHGREHRLREMREERCEHDQRQQHEAAGDQRRDRAFARPPTRSASSPRGSSRPACPETRRRPTFAIPCATDSWLTSMR